MKTDNKINNAAVLLAYPQRINRESRHELDLLAQYGF